MASEESKSISKKEVLALGLMNVLPALLGAAIAGPEAGVAGAAASQKGNDTLLAFRKEEQDRQTELDKIKAATLAKAEAAKEQMDFKREINDENNLIRREIAQANKAPQVGKLSKGQEAVDRNFAKTYENFVAQGGEAGLNRNLDTLEQVREDLKNTDSATGPVVGLLPKGLRDIITPKGAAIQDKIEQVIQQTLRQTLGAQFTENEARELFKRSYNPKLSEQENLNRLDGLMKELKSRAAATQGAARAFEDEGTLSNYKPTSNKEQPMSQKIRVTNGQETLEIDPSDLIHAEKDGYRRI